MTSIIEDYADIAKRTGGTKPGGNAPPLITDESDKIIFDSVVTIYEELKKLGGDMDQNVEDIQDYIEEYHNIETGRQTTFDAVEIFYRIMSRRSRRINPLHRLNYPPTPQYSKHKYL